MHSMKIISAMSWMSQEDLVKLWDEEPKVPKGVFKGAVSLVFKMSTAVTEVPDGFVEMAGKAVAQVLLDRFSDTIGDPAAVIAQRADSLSKHPQKNLPPLEAGWAQTGVGYAVKAFSFEFVRGGVKWGVVTEELLRDLPDRPSMPVALLQHRVWCFKLPQNNL